MNTNTRKAFAFACAAVLLFSFSAGILPTALAANSPLRVTLSSEYSIYSPNEIVKITGNITDPSRVPVQNSSVGLEIRDPNSTLLFLNTVFSCTNGSFSDIFRLPMTSVSGQYAVYAVACKNGYESGSNQTVFNVDRSQILLTAWPEVTSTLRLRNVQLHGKLYYNNTPTADAEILFQIFYPNHTLWFSATSSTSSNGIATCEFYLPANIAPGRYLVNCSSYKAGIESATATTFFDIKNLNPTVYEVKVDPQKIEKPGATDIEANVSDFEDGVSLRTECIITFPNGTVKILNMSLQDSVFRLNYFVCLEYPSGTYQVTVRALDRDGGWYDYRTFFEVIASILKGSIRGWIKNKSGLGIAGGATTLSLKTAYLVYRSASDAAGFYSFSGILPGNYTLTLSAESHSSKTTDIEVMGGQIILQNATLSHLPIITGFVVARSREPIENASVTATIQHNIVGRTVTDGTGAYNFSVTSSGKVTVSAFAQGYSSNSTAVECTLDTVASTNLTLEKNGKVEGLVLDALTGLPIENATAIVSQTSFAESEQTNASGSFAFVDVPPKKYTLMVVADSYLSNVTTISVQSNVTLYRQITLMPTGNITGTVRDIATNAPIKGALVTLMDYRKAAIAAVPTNSAGGYLFYLVKPANYTLRVYACGYNTSTAHATVTAKNVTIVDQDMTPNVIYVSLSLASNQFSRGENLKCVIRATNVGGQSIADNVTSANVHMEGPNNETQDYSATRVGDHFEATFLISADDTIGTWTVMAAVDDVFGNHAEAANRINILQAFLIRFANDRPSYVDGDQVNFTAYISKYSNLSRFIQPPEISAYIEIHDAENNTLARFNATKSGNSVVGQLNTSNMTKGVFSAYLRVADTNGNQMSAMVTFAIVENFHIIVNTDRNLYNRTETVRIYGSITYQNTTPAGNTALTIALVVRSYTRFLNVVTDSSGIFECDFTPLGVDAGNYTIVCSSTIENIERHSIHNFEILGLALEPSRLEIKMSENSANDFEEKVWNIGESDLINLSIKIDPASFGGVAVTLIDPPSPVLHPGTFTTFRFHVNATAGATSNSQFKILATCAQEGIDSGTLEISLFPASPVGVPAPEIIDTSVTAGGYFTQTVSIKNIGYGKLKNATIQQPVIRWVMATTSILGDINPQEEKRFDVIISPSNSTPIGLLEDRIVITSENFTPINIYLIIKITSAENASVLFRVIDDAGLPIPNALIKLQYQQYWLQAECKRANSAGLCGFESLLAGRYSYLVSAENHITVCDTIIAQPGSAATVEVVCPINALQISFTVVPTTIHDEYGIRLGQQYSIPIQQQNYVLLNLTFKTDVPPPLLVAIPPVLQFMVDRAKVVSNGYESTMYFTVQNTGTIPIFNVSIRVDKSASDNYEMTLGDFGQSMSLDEIKAHDSVTLPCRLVLHVGTNMAELENGAVGKIRIKGDFVSFGASQEAEVTETNSEVLVQMIDTGNRRLVADPPIIFVLKVAVARIQYKRQNVMSAFVSTESFPDVVLTNCAESEGAYISTGAMGGGITIGKSFSPIADLVDTAMGVPGLSIDLGFFMTYGEIGPYNQIPQDPVYNYQWMEVKLLEISNDSSLTDPFQNLLIKSLVRYALHENATDWVHLEPGEKALLTSASWGTKCNLPSFGTMLEGLLGVDVSFFGGSATIGYIGFCYKWDLDTTVSQFVVPIFILDLSVVSITLPIPVNTIYRCGSTNSGIEWPKLRDDDVSNPRPPSYHPKGPPTITPVETPRVENSHEIVELSISQDVTLERDAFIATLQITNKLASTRIDKIHISLKATHADGTDASGDFVTRVTGMNGISEIDGKGVIEAGTKAAIDWLLIPTVGAGGTNETGTYYNLQALIEYSIGNGSFTMQSTVETISVKPQPLLHVEYYQSPEVIAGKPFKLGVKVTNIGYGTAHNFKIDTAQPVICDNQANLPVRFSILAAVKQGENVSALLGLEFGDILPGRSVMGYWVLMSSMNGTLKAFNATFSHTNVLGGEETSLIQAVDTHIIMKDLMLNNADFAFLVDNNLDNVPDQVVNPISGEAMSVVPVGTQIVEQNGTSISIKTTKIAGSWIWIDLHDPFNNSKTIAQIQRSDGKVLDPQNYWMKDNRIYIVDDPEENYTIYLGIRELAVTRIILAKNVIGQGYPLSLNVTICNYGEYSEVSNVTIYGNSTMLNQTRIVLARGSLTTLTFKSKTSPLAKGRSNIRVVVDALPSEKNTTDNSLVAGTVYVGIPGDVNADGKVDLKDVYAVAKSYGTTIQGPNPEGRIYVPNLDINDDGKIDLKDYFITCKNYGRRDSVTSADSTLSQQENARGDTRSQSYAPLGLIVIVTLLGATVYKRSLLISVRRKERRRR